MKILRLLLLVMLVLAPLPAAADIVAAPPDGARVLSANGCVTLSWPARGAKRWRLEVTAQERPWFSDTLSVPLAVVRAHGGPRYRWRVIAEGGAEVVSWRGFEVADAPLIDARGRDGAPGRDGWTTGNPGERGQDGTDGQDLEVWVERADGGIRVRTETSRGARESVWLPPSAGPVTVSTAGGRGGRGGRGADGMGAAVHGPGGVTLAVGNGAPGGDGGNGGRGGTIRLHAAAGLEGYVVTVAAGGDGGPGGPGGRGAMGAPGPNDTVIYTAPGAPGPNGRSGQFGASGKIVRVSP